MMPRLALVVDERWIGTAGNKSLNVASIII